MRTEDTEGTSRTRVARVCGDTVVRWVARSPTAPSGREWTLVRSGPGRDSIGYLGPALGKMQGEAAGRWVIRPASVVEPPPQASWRSPPAAQTASALARTGQVMRHHLYRHPGGVGGETLTACGPAPRRTRGLGISRREAMIVYQPALPVSVMKP